MVSGRHITPPDNFIRNYIASYITPPARVEKYYLRKKYAGNKVETLVLKQLVLANGTGWKFGDVGS